MEIYNVEILNDFKIFFQVGYWLAMVGYAISFSAVLAKMWRVYYIFHNPTTNKRVSLNMYGFAFYLSLSLTFRLLKIGIY